jgi:hypothetical protein
MSLEILNNTLGVSSLNDTLGENSSDSEILEVKNLSNNSFSNFSKNISNEYATSSPFGEKSLFYKKNISGVAYNMLISNSIWKYEIITSTKGTELIEKYTKYDEKIDLSKGKYDDDTDLIIYIEESSTINGYLIDTNDICLIRMSQQMLNEYFAIIKSNPQSTILEDWSNFILQQQKNVNNISFTQEKLIEAFKMEIAYRPLKNISVGNSKYTQTEFTNTILDGFSEAFRKLKTDKETWDAALNSDKYFLKNSGKVFGFFKDQLNNAAEILKTVETTLTFFEFIIPTEKPFFKSLKLFINSFQASLHALEIQINTIEKSSPYLFAFICGLWDGTIEFFAGFLDMILIVVKLYFQLNDLNAEDKLVYSKLKEAIIEFIENYIQDPDFLQKAFANALSEYLEERYSNAENGYVIAHNGGEDLIIILDIIVSVVEVVKSLADAGKVLPKFENWVDEAFERNRSLEKKLDEIHSSKDVPEKPAAEVDTTIPEINKKPSAKERVEEKQLSLARKNEEERILRIKNIDEYPMPSYEKGYSFYDARTPKPSEIPLNIRRQSRLLTHKVDKEIDLLWDINYKSGLSKNKIISKNKQGKYFVDRGWLKDRVLVAGMIHRDKKFGEIIVLKTNYPRTAMNRYLKEIKLTRGKFDLDNLKIIFKKFKQEGYLEYDMHPYVEDLLQNHFNELTKGIKHPGYDWDLTGGIPGTHAEVLALNDLLWILNSKGIELSDDVLKGFIGYNKNLLAKKYMIRCGDCQLILKDVLFLEKITNFKKIIKK